MTVTNTLRWSGNFAFGSGFAAIILLFGLVGLWGVNARIAGAVIAPGLIKVEINRQVIQHPDGGIVAEISVRNGDFVKAGQVVLRLDDTDVLSELAILEQRLVELTARIARLKAERDGNSEFEVYFSGLEHVSHTEVEEGQKRLFEARKNSLESELAQTKKKIIQTQSQAEGVDAQIAAIDIQLDLLEQEISTNKKLKEQGLLVQSKLRHCQVVCQRLQRAVGGVVRRSSQGHSHSKDRGHPIGRGGMRWRRGDNGGGGRLC